jgi:uncharacterized membrane protein YccF (DUF307 family)
MTDSTVPDATSTTTPLPVVPPRHSAPPLVPEQQPAGSAAYRNGPAATVNVYQQNYPAHAQQAIVMKNAGPGILIRTVWYLFVGWWLSFWVMVLAGICILSVIALPLGLALVNRLPAVMTLRPSTRRITSAVNALGETELTLREAQQRPMLHRAVYFVFVGWWASIAAMIVAWFLSVTIIGLPLGLMVLNRLPEITTLRRN